MALQPEGSYGRPYVENPNEHLKSVHWRDFEIVPSSISISWSATLITPPGHFLPPVYENGFCTMDVGVDGLPALRSSLRVGAVFDSDGIPVAFPTDIVSGEFPDGSGTLSVNYSLFRFPIPLAGAVGYSTTAVGHDAFGGARSVSVSLAIALQEIVPPEVGYDWTASGGAGGAGHQELSGHADSGGSLSFRATLIIGPPPSFSFSG